MLAAADFKALIYALLPASSLVLLEREGLVPAVRSAWSAGIPRRGKSPIKTCSADHEKLARKLSLLRSSNFEPPLAQYAGIVFAQRPSVGRKFHATLAR